MINGETVNDDLYPRTSVDQVVGLEDRLNSAGRVNTISVNGGEPVEPDENKNVNLILSEGDNTADEEDLTTVETPTASVLKFKDKEYSAANFSGLGKKYVRKNFQEVERFTQINVSDGNSENVTKYSGKYIDVTQGVGNICNIDPQTNEPATSGRWSLGCYKIAAKAGEIYKYDVTRVDSFGPPRRDVTLWALVANEDDPDYENGTILDCFDKNGEDQSFVREIDRIYIERDCWLIINYTIYNSPPAELYRMIPNGTTENVNYLGSNDFNAENTIYIIQYDYDLNGMKLQLPKNSVLDFRGGSIRNCFIAGNNSTIIAADGKIFDLNTKIGGTWTNEEWKPEWFGAKGDGVQDDTEYLQNVLDIKRTMVLRGTYLVTHGLWLKGGSIKGNKTATLNARFYDRDEWIFVPSETAAIVTEGGAVYSDGTYFTGDENNNVYYCSLSSVGGQDGLAGKVKISTVTDDTVKALTFYSSDSVFDATTMVKYIANTSTKSSITWNVEVPENAITVAFHLYEPSENNYTVELYNKVQVRDVDSGANALTVEQLANYTTAFRQWVISTYTFYDGQRVSVKGGTDWKAHDSGLVTSVTGGVLQDFRIIGLHTASVSGGTRTVPPPFGGVKLMDTDINTSGLEIRYVGTALYRSTCITTKDDDNYLHGYQCSFYGVCLNGCCLRNSYANTGYYTRDGIGYILYYRLGTPYAGIKQNTGIDIDTNPKTGELSYATFSIYLYYGYLVSFENIVTDNTDVFLYGLDSRATLTSCWLESVFRCYFLLRNTEVVLMTAYQMSQENTKPAYGTVGVGGRVVLIGAENVNDNHGTTPVLKVYSAIRSINNQLTGIGNLLDQINGTSGSDDDEPIDDGSTSEDTSGEITEEDDGEITGEDNQTVIPENEEETT